MIGSNDITQQPVITKAFCLHNLEGMGDDATPVANIRVDSKRPTVTKRHWRSLGLDTGSEEIVLCHVAISRKERENSANVQANGEKAMMLSKEICFSNWVVGMERSGLFGMEVCDPIAMVNMNLLSVCWVNRSQRTMSLNMGDRSNKISRVLCLPDGTPDGRITCAGFFSQYRSQLVSVDSAHTVAISMVWGVGENEYGCKCHVFRIRCRLLVTGRHSPLYRL